MPVNQELKFLQFLEDDLALSKDEITLALKYSQGDCGSAAGHILAIWPGKIWMKLA